MGGSCSKQQNSKPQHKIVQNRRPTKRVSLLVIYNSTQQSYVHKIDKFCKALNTYPPPSSIMIDNHNDKEFAQLSDTNNLSESDKTNKRRWVSNQLDKGHIVLICLLVNFDVRSFITGIGGNRIIPFHFKSPRVANWDCIEVTCEMDATPDIIRQNMKDLAASIKDENRY